MIHKNKKEILHPDFCVIGGGAGGLSFAAGAAQMGASVVLIERDKMGGDCLNYGCIPSKALLSASSAFDLKKAAAVGWSFESAQVDFKKVHAYIQSVIEAIAPNDSVSRFEGLGVKVIVENAKFLNDVTVGTESYLVRPKRFIIATGSMPFIPLIEGLNSVPYYTNETLFDLQTLPEHLVIIGAGPIGLEMAQAFRRFGSKVTVLEAFAALPKDDPKMANMLKAILISEGIELNEGVDIACVSQTSKGIQCIYKNKQDQQVRMIASHVLVAAGRKPNILNLNLDAAKINASAKGIIVDEYLRTSNSKVYAIGDCTGGYQFTHVAGYHAGLAIRNSIFRLRSKVETRAIAWVTYTAPELAQVGFLESTLKEKKIEYKVLEMSFEKNDRAQTQNSTQGGIKVLVSTKGRILGVSILGKNAGELIYPWVMMIQNNLKISALTSSIAPYPTLSEINKRVADSYYTDKVFGPFMKRVVKLIMGWTR